VQGQAAATASTTPATVRGAIDPAGQVEGAPKGKGINLTSKYIKCYYIRKDGSYGHS
jgi:hypothetical protein